MKNDIRIIVVICVALISGCAHLPGDYYAPTANGGTFLPPISAACFRPLDWVRLSEGGATIDINAERTNDKTYILLKINEFKLHAPTIKMNLGKISISDSDRSHNYLPLNMEQIDVRKSPHKWPIEALLNAEGGYYMLTYPDIGTEQFLLEFPDVLVEDHMVKLPQVMFEKKFGIACDSGK